ncbi:MAG: ribosome small subunit-dependent GTPase A [Cytophagales bacterium]
MPEQTAQKAFITKTTGSFYHIRLDDGTERLAILRGKNKLKEAKVNNPIAVGDFVWCEPENATDEKWVIHEVLERENYLVRNSTHKKGFSHIIASNLDQIVVVASLVNPRTSLGFIDRITVSAESYRIPLFILLNKSDLFDEELLEYADNIKMVYSSAKYPVMKTSNQTGEGIEGLKKLIANKKTLFTGHSGAGKSSLLNTLSPTLNLRTSEVSASSEKGIHTTTFAEMFHLGNNTFVIDTPGIKELGINEIEKEELHHYFPEMRNYLNQCKFNNCLHLNEPGCAVLKAIEDGYIADSRYKSYLSILENQDNRR